MAIREITLGTATKPHCRDFNRSTAAVAQLYTSYLPDFDSAGIVKIFVGVHHTPGVLDFASISFGPPLRLLNVATVEVPLDLAWYAGLPDLAKARLQLDLVHTACLLIGIRQQWDRQPFLEAYAHCQRANLANAWVLKVGKQFTSSPNRQFTACLVCQWTVATFQVDLVILATGSSEPQIKTVVANDAANPIRFHTLTWVDNRTVKVTALAPLREWQVAVEG
jgi:hypothetical protein